MKHLKDFLKNYDKTLKVLIYIALFLSLIFPYADKDWGWHYKYGKYFLENGQIMVRDIYSWTLSGYAWINHSWLYDPILYILTNSVGFVGLSILGALICFLVFYFLTKGSELNYWQLAICAFFFSSLFETGILQGLRSQILGLLPFAVLMYTLVKGRENPKLFSFIPLIFLIWANLHGTFAFGMVILGVFFTSYFFEFKQYRKRIITVGILSFLLTLLNPFTHHPYLEVVRHTGNPYLKNVFEWMPIYTKCPDCHTSTFILYWVALVAAILTNKKLINLPYFLVILGLTLQTISARRYLPLFTVATFPLFVDFVKNNKYKFLDLSLYKITPFIVAFLVLISIEFNLVNRLPSFNFYRFSEADFCNHLGKCPIMALEHLKANPPEGRGINFYDWGGYMIGKDFPTKLFVDGRMHLWEVKGYSPFGDYIRMYYQRDANLVRQYDFDWALVETESEIAKMIQSGEVGMWKLNYADNDALYYTRLQ